MGMRQNEKHMDAVIGAAILLSGCGTSTVSRKSPEDVVLSSPVSFAEASESAAAERPTQGAEEESEALWTDESVQTMEEWAALSAAQTETRGAKEETGEFLEGVRGLMDRLDRIREEENEDN